MTKTACPRASTNVRSVQHGANMQCSQAAFVFPHSCGTSPIHLDRQSAPLRMKNATRCSAHEFASARAVIVLPVPALPRRPVGVSYARHTAVRHLPITYARYAVYAMGCAIYSMCGSAVLIDQPS